MKKLLCITLFSIATGVASAQVSLGYFPFNYHMVQLTSNPDNMVFGDIRLETNSFVSNLNLEVAPLLVNLKRTTAYNFYLGPGININPLNEVNVLNGYFLTTGIRWMPFEKLRSLALVFELSPMAFERLDGAQLRSFLGLSYHFRK